MRSMVLFLLALCICSAVTAQQKAMFTQYVFNGQAINPAYSSMDDAFTITGVHRQQWTGFEGAPNTQSLTLHSPVKKTNTSLGLMLMRDHIGEVINETGAYATMAQRVHLNDETYFAAGIMAGVSRYTAGYSQIADDVSGLDPLFANQNDNAFNLGFGLMLFSDQFYAGFSSPFFLSKNIGNTGVNHYKPHYLLQGGYLAPLGSLFKVKPNILLKYVAGAPLQADLNVNLLVAETVWVGGSWRSLDSFDALLQVQVTKALQLGYSYDFITSQLSNTQKGTHEVMLKYRIPVKGRGFPVCYF